MAKPATPVFGRMIDKFTMGDGCWVWTGAKTEHGYGKVLTYRSIRAAHRVLYELLVGPVPDGFELDHLCRNPACVNPDHLEPVTHRENIRRGVSKTHCPKGHEYAASTNYTYSYGRYCRSCHLERSRQNYYTRKEMQSGMV